MRDWDDWDDRDEAEPERKPEEREPEEAEPEREPERKSEEEIGTFRKSEPEITPELFMSVMPEARPKGGNSLKGFKGFSGKGFKGLNKGKDQKDQEDQEDRAIHAYVTMRGTPPGAESVLRWAYGRPASTAQINEVNRRKREREREAPLAERTITEYLNVLFLLPMPEGPGAVLTKLVQIAREKSPPRYRMYRSAALWALELTPWSPLEKETFREAVRALPPLTKSSKATPITRRRRRKKDVGKLQEMVRPLPTEERALIAAIVCTGARQAELPSLRLSPRKNGIAVSIENVKGSAGKRRDFYLPISSPEGKEMWRVYEAMGDRPFEDMTLRDIRKFAAKWKRICVETKGVDPVQYSLHGLRHQFASNTKLLYGGTNRRVAERLGHVDMRTTRVYGNSLSAWNGVNTIGLT